MNILSIVIALIVFLITLVGLVPLFGWLNWIGLLLGAVGVLFGMLSRHRLGTTLNIILMLIGGLRLVLGGGLL
ncbi:hypothetical protein [uncultured Sphingomonas sp.]|uniref:hypothetical protein n=1 Tax=uncultured Sphingomonas sp. TaxID=158754 RepID=UPI0035CA02B1